MCVRGGGARSFVPSLLRTLARRQLAPTMPAAGAASLSRLLPSFSRGVCMGLKYLLSRACSCNLK